MRVGIRLFLRSVFRSDGMALPRGVVNQGHRGQVPAVEGRGMDRVGCGDSLGLIYVSAQREEGFRIAGTAGTATRPSPSAE